MIDTTGQPVAEMTVSAKRTDDDHEASMFTMSGPRRDNVTTGPDGTYKLVGLEAGTYEMHARHPQDWSEDFESIEKTDKKKKVEVAVVVGQEKSGVTITVEARNGVIKGVVIGSDKNPAADAWVTAKRVPAKPAVAKPGDGKDDDAEVQNQDWWPESEPVLTGPDGKFTIGKLRDGTYVVVADGPHGGSRAEKKDVKPGDTIQITLAPLATITGKVTSAGAPVNPYSIECTGATQIERSVAAADGAYKLEHVAPGSYTCSISSDAGTASDKLDVPAGDVTHDFALTPWASITGTVVSMFDKSPVPGLNALIAGQNSDGGMADLIAGGGNKTDATGHFTIPKAPVGKGNLLIMDATSGFKPLATKDYTITTGQRVDVGAIEVVPPRKGEAGTFGLVAEITGVTGPKDLDQAKLAVTQVKPGGPAANAGILVGDVITTIGDKTVGTLGAVNAQNYLSSGSIGIGVTVTLGIDRAGQKLAVQITSVKW
ncbi:MAG TPA: PDZ domain-containing protein [Kofleriaceae bacterium]